MVLMASRLSSQVFEIYDERLQPIGEVTLPANPRLVGVGEGTVYLARPVPKVDNLVIGSLGIG